MWRILPGEISAASPADPPASRTTSFTTHRTPDIRRNAAVASARPQPPGRAMGSSRPTRRRHGWHRARSAPSVSSPDRHRRPRRHAAGAGSCPSAPRARRAPRVVRATSEHVVRHRDERVQVEWARLAHSHTSDSTFVATADGVSQLPGQHPCSSHAQRAGLRRRRRHQQVKNILLHAVEIDVPGDHSRARGSTPESGKLIGSPNDGEAVVQPIGVRQPHQSGPACGLSALGRLRHAGVLTNGWRRCRHIRGAQIRNAGATVRIVCRRGFLRTPLLFAGAAVAPAESGWPARRAARRRPLQR